jgi:hypothetical protein
MSALVSTPGVNTNNQTSGELVTAEAADRAAKEIEGMMIVAKKYPRDESRCFQMVMKSCQRFTFAEEAAYAYPRGDTQVTGPAVYLARELARIWGNISHGCKIINDTEHHRTIRCFAHDFETNTRVESDAEFSKMIYRRNKGWIKPDERDLRELTNRHAAIAVRNCILHVLPNDLVTDALDACQMTIESGIKEDPEKHTKTVLKSFLSLKITADDLKKYLGCEVGKASPAQIASLRLIYSSIRDGNSKWSDYVQEEAQPGTTTAQPKSAEELKQQLAGQAPAEKKQRRARKVQPGPQPQPEPAPAPEATQSPPPPPKTVERSFTDTVTEGQRKILDALALSSPERKKALDDRLRSWDMQTVGEVNFGTAKELIVFLEGMKTEETPS